MIDQLTVDDFMTNLVVTFRRNDPLTFVARKLLHNRISGAPVTDKGKLVGIITQSDIQRGLLSKVDKTVGELMTNRVVVARPFHSILAAAALLDRRGLRRLPVIDGEGFVVGVIARADIIRALAADNPAKAATA